MRIPYLVRPLAGLAVLIALPGAIAAADDDARPIADLPEVARFTFEDASLGGWTFTDNDAWRLTELPGGGHALEQHKASEYEPKVRSPFNIALAPDVDVSDFVMTLKVKSTGRDYGHRDVCLFFDYQDQATSITSIWARRPTPTPTASSSSTTSRASRSPRSEPRALRGPTSGTT